MNKLIQFVDIITDNYPKFNIFNETVIFKFNNITIILFDIQIYSNDNQIKPIYLDFNKNNKNNENNENNENDENLLLSKLSNNIRWKELIINIIENYVLTDNLQYSIKYLDIPFSFLLIDLNIHKTFYNFYFVIQSFDPQNYYLDNNTIHKNSTILLNNISLEKGMIHSFTLDQKVLSMWKYQETNKYCIYNPPPFYISYMDFINFIIDEKKNNLHLPNDYGIFLLNILNEFNNIEIDKNINKTILLYNYNIENNINKCVFVFDNYIINNTLIKFYLLIYPHSRFIDRKQIIEYMTKLL